MNDFQHYLQRKRVHKVSPNKELATSLLKSVEDREKSTLQLNPGEQDRIIFENLKCFKIQGNIMHDLGRFRNARDNSEYYGKITSLENAEEIKQFYKDNKPIIFNLIQEKLK